MTWAAMTRIDTGRADGIERAPGMLPHDPAGRDDELVRLARTLLTRWKQIGTVVALATGLAVLGLRQLPPAYIATAEILIDPGQAQYADLADAGAPRQTTVWPTELETYMKVLWSDELAADVVNTVGLAAFTKEAPPWAPLEAWVLELARPLLPHFQDLAASLGLPSQPPLLALDADPAASAARPGETALDKAVAVFREQLVVSRESLAAVIEIGYRAADPELAAKVANATAEAFPRELIRAEKAALGASANYLGERVAALAQELQAADAEAQALRRRLSDFGSGSLNERRYAELLKTLSEAQAQLVNARNDSSLVADRTHGLSERFTTPQLKELRLLETELAQRLAELGSDLQARHPAVATVRAEQAEIRSRIRAEEEGIRQQIASEEQLCLAKVAWIEGELQAIEQELALSATDQLQLKQLTTRTDSTRLLYQDILTRYQRAREQQLMVRAPARMINAARVPTRPEGKKRLILLGGALLGSLAAATGLVLLLELRRRGYRSAEELQRTTRLPVIGCLPAVDRRVWGDRPDGGHGFAQKVYGEAVRRAALRLMTGRRSPQGMAELILVTSAKSGEGKTLVSLSLGRQLAGNGLKVLVIDTDLRRQSLTGHLQHLVLPKADLVALLTEPVAKVEDALVRDERFGVDFLLAQETSSDPARLFGSPAMAGLLAELRTRYDVILCDSPPILALTDTVPLVPLADRVLFVTRWQDTARNVVEVALDEIRLHGGRSCELILNAVNLRKYARHAGSDQLAHFRLSASYLR
ncbi:MAG TPA: AAA family ATPase [Geminicoccus sp.]|uniref:GumC family protein n=1 Tax=Geminicoccus sp. TaxID=2024832 RepID=UPI002B78E20A|nr:AAA family ATPase [Geminicoccus sp.]HWL71472.1 AAA family ATPase [Geminicoccus sp.]